MLCDPTKGMPSCYPRIMKFGVLVFPGSNCDHDTYNVIAEIAHQPVTFLWHDSEDLQGVDAVWYRAALPMGTICAPGPLHVFRR